MASCTMTPNIQYCIVIKSKNSQKGTEVTMNLLHQKKRSTLWLWCCYKTSKGAKNTIPYTNSGASHAANLCNTDLQSIIVGMKSLTLSWQVSSWKNCADPICQMRNWSEETVINKLSLTQTAHLSFQPDCKISQSCTVQSSKWWYNGKISYWGNQSYHNHVTDDYDCNIQKPHNAGCWEL